MSIQLAQRSEGFFAGSTSSSAGALNEPDLFFQSWVPRQGQVKADLILTHGICEHSDAYEAAAERLVGLGFAVHAHDLRGHGRSQGQRGVIDGFDRFRQDLSRFIAMLLQGPLKGQTRPVYLLGHSMGGLITLDFIAHELVPRRIVGAILSSPALGVSMPIPQLKLKLGELMLKIAPNVTLPADIQYDALISDPHMIEQYKIDPLRHEKVSAQLFFGMRETFCSVAAAAKEITLPLLILASAHDKVVSADATMNFFDHVQSENKRLRLFEKSEHEILNEPEVDDVLSEIENFIQSQTKGN